VPKLGAIELTFNVAESTQGLQQQIEVFRRTLWVYLGAAGVALLALEIVMLRLGLKPLRRVARDLEEIERGAADRLSGPYPRELESLTQTLNDFIESEREHRERYRHTLADLAHSLKTPLAVARAELEGEKQGTALNAALASQLHRMDEIVAYQLSRPATSGHKIMAKPLAIEARAEQIVKSLEMLHADRGVVCEFDFDPSARFFGEEGDLMELLGNLLENAFKWANKRVSLSAEALTPRRARRPGLRLVVADDGPGVPEDEVDVLGHRGVRGDERVQGHGIGLAIVHDLLAAYRGRLTISRSEALGGACFTVTLPPVM
jgi:two-component system sensor histidine kinase PhoQ